ncbi:hypothetical protein BDV36DRAFT_223018 [Aspergillus pseudocaelatus]|uniref:HNH nuclease domain-containing protein n=1 Tax=Aspergillus pseudocaelatus TaxID=1825620 RepID=A0ABQ6WZI4_9EURO|nr:hypothetical protein BDV36DRAFT_223018 [Aspergillus pseudocaelatus]
MFLNPSFLTCPHMSLPASQSSSFIPFLHLFHHTDLNTSSRDPCFCAFWAVLTFADVEALRKSILECEKSTFLLGFCMHACMHRDPVTLGTESTRKALISPSNETTRVDLSRKRKIVDVAHIYPHYLIADRRNNFTITFPPLWKMLEYFGHRTKAKRWHDKIFTNPIDPTR